MVYPELYEVLSKLFRKTSFYTTSIIGGTTTTLPHVTCAVGYPENWNKVKEYLPEGSEPEDWQPWTCVYYAVYGEKPGEYGATLRKRKKWFTDFINQLEEEE